MSRRLFWMVLVSVSAVLVALAFIFGILPPDNNSQAAKCLTTGEVAGLLVQKFPNDTPATPATIRCEGEWAIGSTEGTDGVMLFQHAPAPGWLYYAAGSYWGEEDDDDVCTRVPRSFLKDLAGCSS